MNYYEILEVSQNASQEVIKAAYKSLMQRYHPDRNPDNPESAEHALLVGLAYEVLADPNRRAAYDMERMQQLPGHLISAGDKRRDVQVPSASKSKSAAKDNRFYWYLWLLIALTILSGLLILSVSKKKPSPESELNEIRLSIEGKQLTQQQLHAKFKRMDEIFREHPEILHKEASERAKEKAARTIPVLNAKLTVNLSNPGQPLEPGHVLSIPRLFAIVGTFDADKFMLHMEKNKEYINQKLALKLAYAKYDELIKIEGEHYLREFILDSIGDITGTSRYEDYPSSSAESPGRYGVVEVLFPESFSVQ